MGGSIPPALPIVLLLWLQQQLTLCCCWNVSTKKKKERKKLMHGYIHFEDKANEDSLHHPNLHVQMQIKD